MHVQVIVTAVTILVLTTQPPSGPQPLTGGGEVVVRQEQGDLFVTVSGPRAGLASLCVADDRRVRILHASAAVGEATYQRSGDTWVLTSKFDFKLRDTRTGPPTEQERSDYLSSMGWVANASRTGEVKREFKIRLSEANQYLGVTFFTTNEPMSVSHWPASMDDDCRAVGIAQGYLPATATFRPATWHRVG